MNVVRISCALVALVVCVAACAEAPTDPASLQSDEPSFPVRVVEVSQHGANVVAESSLTRAQQLAIIERRKKNSDDTSTSSAPIQRALTVTGDCSDWSTIIVASQPQYAGQWVCYKYIDPLSYTPVSLPFPVRSYYGSATNTFTFCTGASGPCRPGSDSSRHHACPWYYAPSFNDPYITRIAGSPACVPLYCQSYCK